MKNADFYQDTANAMGVPLYLYTDGSVTNVRRIDIEPAATVEPHKRWRPPDDHGLGEQVRQH